MDICAGKGSKMEEKNKTQDARNIKGMDEDQFQAELAELMKEEPGGKKKKGKNRRIGKCLIEMLMKNGWNGIGRIGLECFFIGDFTPSRRGGNGFVL